MARTPKSQAASSRLVCGIVRSGVALLAASGALVAGAGVAAAANPGPDALPITVVTVKTEDAFDQAEALTQSLRKVVRDADGWSLGEGDYSLEYLTVKMKCAEPIDAACETRIADVIKADRFIWTVVKLDGTNVVGEVHMFVRGKGTNRAELKYSANLTEPQDDALLRVAREALATVTGGAPKGAVRIKAGGIAGQVFIDGEAVGALPAEGAEFQLESGKPHRIVVKAPGKSDAETTATVKPSATEEVNITLVDAPTDTSIDGRMIGGFVSIGLGVAAGAVGLWAALDVNSIRNDPDFDAYRAIFPPNLNACDQAKDGVKSPGLGAIDPERIADMCDRAGSREIIQAVTFPVAAVAIGVGAYLLGTSNLAGGDSESTARVTLVPLLGPDTQALALVGTY
ncbi:MAG: hypothetical protein HY908_01010 [Myxococcales bacterium]|nr:hypothetical protein [Myxococcales bacterium]